MIADRVAGSGPISVMLYFERADDISTAKLTAYIFGRIGELELQHAVRFPNHFCDRTLTVQIKGIKDSNACTLR